jgi:hypothetical protein
MAARVSYHTSPQRVSPDQIYTITGSEIKQNSIVFYNENAEQSIIIPLSKYIKNITIAYTGDSDE